MPLIPNPRRFFRFTCDGKYTEKDLDRYSSYVDTTPGLGPKGNCWEWRGHIRKDGYGDIGISKNGKKRDIKVHRVAYEMATGILIPDGKVVMHKCDNRKCVKVFIHLLIGTNKDNSDDMINKGRQAHNICEKHGMAKFTWVQVREIRRLWLTGKYTQLQLANKFGVVNSTISSIIGNKIWYDSKYIVVKFDHHLKKLNKEQADEIRRLHSTGKYMQKQLADIFGVSKVNIYLIINNKRWV